MVHQMSFSKFKKRINVTHWSKKWALKFKLRLQSLGQEDPLEKEMATHSSILAWEIPQRSLQGYSPWGFKRVGHNWVTKQYPRGKVTTNVGGLKIHKTDGRQEKKGMTEDGWDGWMASQTRWTWVWASSGSWWWTGRPGHGVAKSQTLAEQLNLTENTNTGIRKLNRVKVFQHLKAYKRGAEKMVNFSLSLSCQGKPKFWMFKITRSM